MSYKRRLIIWLKEVLKLKENIGSIQRCHPNFVHLTGESLKATNWWLRE